MKPVLIFQFRFIFDSSFISIEKANDRILNSGFLFYSTLRESTRTTKENRHIYAKSSISGIIDNTEMEIRRFMTTKVQLKYISAKKKRGDKKPKAYQLFIYSVAYRRGKLCACCRNDHQSIVCKVSFNAAQKLTSVTFDIKSLVLRVRMKGNCGSGLDTFLRTFMAFNFLKKLLAL